MPNKRTATIQIGAPSEQLSAQEKVFMSTIKGLDRKDPKLVREFHASLFEKYTNDTKAGLVKSLNV